MIIVILYNTHKAVSTTALCIQLQHYTRNFFFFIFSFPSFLLLIITILKDTTSGGGGGGVYIMRLATIRLKICLSQVSGRRRRGYRKQLNLYRTLLRARF